MKLSFSNIAWQCTDDDTIHSLLQSLGFDGIEIAPTRWFPHNPYDHIEEAILKAQRLESEYGLSVSSIQSIWYNRTEKLFGTGDERQTLLSYTRQAVDFAHRLQCQNLVFGCPKNRIKPVDASMDDAISFFYECGVYAAKYNTRISLEPNPPIYNTNFINDTREAFDFVKLVNCPGFRVNVDLGTMIYYHEPVSLVEKHIEYVHHVHISEPLLASPSHDDICENLVRMLALNGFAGYVSVEMSSSCGLDAVNQAARKVAGMVLSLRNRRM